MILVEKLIVEHNKTNNGVSLKKDGINRDKSSILWIRARARVAF